VLKQLLTLQIRSPVCCNQILLKIRQISVSN
jgi:hypothetical protein